MATFPSSLPIYLASFPASLLISMNGSSVTRITCLTAGEALALYPLVKDLASPAMFSDQSYAANFRRSDVPIQQSARQPVRSQADRRMKGFIKSSRYQ